MAPTLPRRVLVANRGEIALRIGRTCHAAGVEVVAVYSPLEPTAPHVVAAEAAVEVPDYVTIAALVDAARTSGCDAVHPGYGFLAESAAFARAVQEADLVWIGPSPGAMEVMGSKTASRAAMQEAGVPVVPGTPALEPDELEAAAAELGYPVLLKAVAGGGGKGMAVVEEAGDLRRLAATAAEEARRSFGDGSVYLEKLLPAPRHVEVQVFGDRHGTIVSLGERECSIQRRHQKIVEESPSPAVDADLRDRMAAAAVAAARAVEYEGAGTVEFLLSGEGEFHFLEMNTRLQVEHPVTEWVTGLDLVRLQLEVAAGGELPPEAVAPRLAGHAVECRIYAEDPTAGYLPQSGPLLRVREPAGPGIRIDSALREGDEVSVHFDPMLAKLTTWGRTRDLAIERMREALSRTVILGVRTNVDQLQEIMAHPAFVAGDLSTDFLERHMAATATPPGPPAVVLGATALPATGHGGARRGRRRAGPPTDPWGSLGGLRIGSGGGTRTR